MGEPKVFDKEADAWRNQVYAATAKSNDAQKKQVDESAYDNRNISTLYKTDAQVSEYVDKNIELSSTYAPTFRELETLYDKQTFAEAFGRAIYGGVGKGGAMLLENAGYLIDVAEWTGLYEDFDKGGNWLSSSMKDVQGEIDESAPIYSKGLGDAGWWMQGLQSTVSSAVAYGLPGGVVTKGIGMAGKALGASNVVAGNIAKFGTGMAMNYAESMTMATDLYRNVYDSAIASGVDPATAKEKASEHAEEFVWKNKINIISNVAMLSNTLRGAFTGKISSKLSEGAQRSLKGSIAHKVKDMGAEAFEELSSSFLSNEEERDAKIELGIIGDNKSSMLNRALSYVKSDEGITDATFGAIGGPFQAGLSRAIGGVKDKINMTPPKEFTKEAPQQTVKDPGAYADWLKTNNKTVETSTSEDKAAYESTKATFDKEQKEVKNYNIAKEEHQREVDNWNELNATKNIGKKSQTIQDVKNLLLNDGANAIEYRDAVMNNDIVKAKNIEKNRFENLFLRYAKQEAVNKNEGSLEFQLKEVLKNEGATAEEKASAQRFLDKLPEYNNLYNSLRASKKRQGYVDYAFAIKSRLEATKETLIENNDLLVKAQIDLAKDLKAVTGKDVSQTEIQVVTLRKEAYALKQMQKTQEVAQNPYLNDLIEAKLKANNELQKTITESLSDEQNETLKSKVIEDSSKIEDLNKAIDNQAGAYAAHSVFHKLNKDIESGKFFDIEKNNYEELSNSIIKIENKTQLARAIYAVNNRPLSERDKKKLLKQLDNKDNEITARIETTQKEYQAKQELVEGYKASIAALQAERETIVKDIQKGVAKDVSKLKKLKKAQKGFETNKTKQYIQDQIDTLENKTTDELDNINFEIDWSHKKISNIQAEINEIMSDFLTKEFGDDLESILEKFEKNQTTAEEKQKLADAVSDPKLKSKLNTVAAQQKVTDEKVTTKKQSDKDGVIHSVFAPVKAEVIEMLDESSSPNNIAYASGTDGVMEVAGDSSLAEYLEQTTSDKKGMLVEYVIDSEDATKFPNLAEVMSQYEVGLLGDDVLTKLPIRMYLLNKDGSKVMYNDKPVFGYMPSATGRSSVIVTDILDNLDKGERVYTKIERVSNGRYKTDGIENSAKPLEILGDFTLAISDGNNLKDGKKIVKGSDGKDLAFKGSSNGFVFAIVKAPNGNKVPIRLNGRKLTNSEVDVISQVVTALAKGTKEKPVTFNTPINMKGSFEGMTIGQILDFAIFEGKDSIIAQNPFFVNLADKNLTIGSGDAQMKIPFAEIDTPENKKIIIDYLKGMWKHISSDMINQKMSKKYGQSIVWDGKAIKLDDNYNDVLSADGTLSTNVQLFKDGKPDDTGVLFIAPRVTVGNHFTNAKPNTNAKPLVKMEIQGLGNVANDEAIDNAIEAGIKKGPSKVEMAARKQAAVAQASSEVSINIYAGTEENADLSNFAHRPFTYKGYIFQNVEAAFQAMKIEESVAVDVDNTEIMNKLISKTITGSEAKLLGRKIKELDVKHWDDRSSAIMEDLLRASFEQNPDALQKLLATGNATLTHTQDKGKWSTEFPKLLMSVREEFAQAKDETIKEIAPVREIKETPLTPDMEVQYMLTGEIDPDVLNYIRVKKASGKELTVGEQNILTEKGENIKNDVPLSEVKEEVNVGDELSIALKKEQEENNVVKTRCKKH